MITLLNQIVAVLFAVTSPDQRCFIEYVSGDSKDAKEVLVFDAKQLEVKNPLDGFDPPKTPDPYIIPVPLSTETDFLRK